MSRERVGKYLRRAGYAVAGVSTLIMVADTVVMNTQAAQEFPQEISFSQKAAAGELVGKYDQAKDIISTYLSLEDATRLDSAEPLLEAKRTISIAEKRDQDYKARKEELEGNRPWFYIAGVIGGLTLAAIGDKISIYRRRIITAVSS